jgi:hypothetical protein
MLNQKLKLNYIESGRMSENEMSSIYAGVWNCEKYHKCSCPPKNGKSSCIGGYQSCSDTNPTVYTTCRTSYLWVSEYDDEMEIADFAYITNIED